MSGVMNLAFKDITKYMVQQKIKVTDDQRDVWFVTPTTMNTREVRLLNYQLGLHRLNKARNYKN